MKKTYKAPRLSTHGTVSEITAWTKDSSRKDFFFGAPNGTTVVDTAEGSDDACYIPKGEKQCQ